MFLLWRAKSGHIQPPHEQIARSVPERFIQSREQSFPRVAENIRIFVYKNDSIERLPIVRGFVPPENPQV